MIPEICIGMITTGHVHADTVRWLLMQGSCDRYRVGYEFNVGRLGHARQRNILTRRFLKTSATHLLFVDDDVSPPAEGTIERMLEAGKDVVTGVVPRFDREHGIMPMVYRRHEGATVATVTAGEPAFAYAVPATEDLEQVGGAGGGCFMIRRHVLEAIGDPWFDTIELEGGGPALGEDLFFCLRLAELGFELWVDWRIRCAHFKEIPLF